MTTTTTTTGAGGSGGSAPASNGFPAHWADGLACATEPEVAVWAYDDDTFILRQSLCTNFEGPFLYLLFGEDKVSRTPAPAPRRRQKPSPTSSRRGWPRRAKPPSISW